MQLRDARVVSRRALAIGRFGRSRWLLAADAVELWELLGSWSVRRRDCQPGAGSEEWRCSNNGAEWVDVARVGGGLKPLIGGHLSRKLCLEESRSGLEAGLEHGIELGQS